MKEHISVKTGTCVILSRQNTTSSLPPASLPLWLFRLLHLVLLLLLHNRILLLRLCNLDALVWFFLDFSLSGSAADTFGSSTGAAVSSFFGSSFTV
ncbi:hypothetical protein BLNAU_22003 [Blattamonas nauphoetae]|uniref:Uncharacterized protein n=1 Tax=Blattamonas nauphoetae TaxID=2049346 RepID=A0ABQ9WUB8_9EUKA|nr:hypothetical protein BLNAU_22003 [Blattamonas nauphoetae]